MSSKDTMEQVFSKVIFGTDGQSAKTTIKRLNTLIASEREAAVREFAEDLKQYRGAYIGIDGRRVDNMVAHQIIDERLARWGKE